MDMVDTFGPLLALAVVAGVILAVIAWQVWLARWRWRQKGIGFAEGWFMVVDQREGRDLRRELYPGQRRTAAPQPPTAPTLDASINTAPTDPDLHAQYTITGKRIR